MKVPRKLQPHPRLFIGREVLERLRRPAAGWPVLGRARAAVDQQAREFLKTADFKWQRNTHNAHLVRARAMQYRIQTLLVEYRLTDRKPCRNAVMEHVRAMERWEYWSWIAWRRKDPRPEAIFDLSYGENSATLAMAYDLLHAELTAKEKREFLSIIRRRALRPCLAHVARAGKRAWWYGKADTNWNTVCAGGAGMLCLAAYDDLPEARKLLPLLDRSVCRYMEHYRETDGGWEEGVGYWNYGMRYGLMYLLSMEHATGRRHPMLEQAATRRSLRFPLDFSPHGVAAGFNDANSWAPMPVHLAAAERVGDYETLAELLRLMDRQVLSSGTGPWSTAAELLLLHPRRRPASVQPQNQVARVYRGLDWGYLADRMPEPGLYCSVRGGSSAVPHGQRDISSYNVLVGNEALITNPSSGRYLDTTFSSRREELIDLTPQAKNVILINGVGVEPRSGVDAGRVTVAGLPGIRVDVTRAMGLTYQDRAAARFCGRLFVMLGDRALLVVDRVECDHVALIETRLNTTAAVKVGTGDARLQGRRKQCRVAFAASRPARLLLCRPGLTWPMEPPTQLRWSTADLFETVTFATLITPGTGGCRVAVSEGPRSITVRASGHGWSRRIVLSKRLRT